MFIIYFFLGFTLCVGSIGMSKIDDIFVFWGVKNLVEVLDIKYRNV